MKTSIIENTPALMPWLPWLTVPQRQVLQRWEQSELDTAVVDAFGFHAVQLAGLDLQALRVNRMPHRWSVSTEFEAGTGPDIHACVDTLAWPWAQDSLDLVCMPHVLERSHNPHATLREAHRVLMPEGRLVLTGINPWSVWGLKHTSWRRQHMAGESGAPVQLLGVGRLKDWLRLLGFEIERCDYGLWLTGSSQEPAQGLTRWLDRRMATLAEPLGSAYCIVAIKKVQGMRLIKGASWKPVGSGQVAAVPLARTHVRTGGTPNYQQESAKDA
jgi:SAM-dependent methyltransferase